MLEVGGGGGHCLSNGRLLEKQFYLLCCFCGCVVLCNQVKSKPTHFLKVSRNSTDQILSRVFPFFCDYLFFCAGVAYVRPTPADDDLCTGVAYVRPTPTDSDLCAGVAYV